MNPAFATHPSTAHASAAAAATMVVRRSRSASIEQHTQQLQDWNLRYDQLDAGRFSGQFTDIRLPGMQLFVESTSRRVRRRGELTPNSIGVGTMLHGDRPLCVNGVRCNTGSLVACNATELDMVSPPDCMLGGVVVDANELLDAAQDLGGLDRHFKPGRLLVLTPPQPMLVHWRQLLLDAVQAAVDAPDRQDTRVYQRLRDDLLFTMIDAVTGAFVEDRVHRPDQRRRIVDRACDLMLSREHEQPSLLDVCRRVGASPRKLCYCFQDSFGVSPGRYIKIIRLNAVRRELSRSDDPHLGVYDAAARWGFWHFGHFSADYKKLFAELPSETLTHARGLHSDVHQKMCAPSVRRIQ